MLSKPFRGFNPSANVSQIFHAGHKAVDLVNKAPNFGYGTPLCAPEDVRVELIFGDTATPGSTENLDRGYGIWMRGLDTGLMHQYWHTLPLLPVSVGQLVKRGQIVAFMGNAGLTYSDGKFVPLSARIFRPYPGTHLHWAVYKDASAPYKGTKIDPLPLLDMTEPTYTTTDMMKATVIVLTKRVNLLTLAA